MIFGHAAKFGIELAHIEYIGANSVIGGMRYIIGEQGVGNMEEIFNLSELFIPVRRIIKDCGRRQSVFLFDAPAEEAYGKIDRIIYGDIEQLDPSLEEPARFEISILAPPFYYCKVFAIENDKLCRLLYRCDDERRVFERTVDKEYLKESFLSLFNYLDGSIPDLAH